MAVGKLQQYSRRRLRRSKVGQDQVLLELATGVAFGKEKVRGWTLHPDHIGGPRDGLRVAGTNITEVGGPLHHHWLGGTDHDCGMVGQVGSTIREDGAACSACNNNLLCCD